MRYHDLLIQQRNPISLMEARPPSREELMARRRDQHLRRLNLPSVPAVFKTLKLVGPWGPDHEPRLVAWWEGPVMPVRTFGSTSTYQACAHVNFSLGTGRGMGYLGLHNTIWADASPSPQPNSVGMRGLQVENEDTMEDVVKVLESVTTFPVTTDDALKAIRKPRSNPLLTRFGALAKPFLTIIKDQIFAGSEAYDNTELAAHIASRAA